MFRGMELVPNRTPRRLVSLVVCGALIGCVAGCASSTHRWESSGASQPLELFMDGERVGAPITVSTSDVLEYSGRFHSIRQDSLVVSEGEGFTGGAFIIPCSSIELVEVVGEPNVPLHWQVVLVSSVAIGAILSKVNLAGGD